MKSPLLLLLAALAAVPLASSCDTVPAVDVPKEVRVPVPVACVDPADLPERPALRTEADLMAMDTYRRTLAAWQDLKRWEAYGAKLEAITTACSRLHVEPAAR